MQGYNQQQRIHNEADEDEFTSLVNQQGCGDFYWKMEKCMDDNGRNLLACSKEMEDWRKCYFSFKKQQDELSAKRQQQQQQ